MNTHHLDQPRGIVALRFALGALAPPPSHLQAFQRDLVAAGGAVAVYGGRVPGQPLAWLLVNAGARWWHVDEDLRMAEAADMVRAAPHLRLTLRVLRELTLEAMLGRHGVVAAGGTLATKQLDLFTATDSAPLMVRAALARIAASIT